MHLPPNAEDEFPKAEAEETPNAGVELPNAGEEEAPNTEVEPKGEED